MAIQLEYAIIADDLTGACDCGVQFVHAQYRTVVLFDDNLKSLPKDFDAIAMDTETRLLTSAKAYMKVKQVGSRFKEAKIVYKKIDSALRGPIAAELSGALDSTGRRIAIIAPALPSQGRTTNQGIQLQHGVPIHQTELARDPLNPIRESRIASLLDNKGLGPVANIAIEDLKNQTYIQSVLQKNRWIISDAETDDHLDVLIHSVQNPEEVLWVGSAGLARAIGNCYPNTISRTIETYSNRDTSHERPLRTLIVIGSRSQVTYQQIAYVAKQKVIPTISLDVSTITDNSRPAMVDSVVRSVSKYLYVEKPVLIYLREEDAVNTNVAKPVPFHEAKLLSNWLADIVVELSKKNLIDALILSGGETAVAVSRRLGAWGINLFGELISGIPYGTLLGDHHFVVTTKSGSFGLEDTLFDCIITLNKHGGLCLSL
jgi:uncharacterized protein YgbK (DUF1537 family)